MHRFLSLFLAVQANALKKVLVTGAGGRTGKLVFEQLKADSNYKPVGLARSAKAQKALKAVGASDDEVCVADIAEVCAHEVWAPVTAVRVQLTVLRAIWTREE